jgi:hypothetical protein
MALADWIEENFARVLEARDSLDSVN